MMRKLIFLVVLVALLSGCSPWIGIHKIEPGMSKAEVMQQMGKPNSASGSGNEEYLWYIPANRFWERYYVHIVNGKVEAYGQQSKETTQTEQ
jgi:outer membrane protein assembly factor BamE (lipoprotein component of BamABCDE complex)